MEDRLSRVVLACLVRVLLWYKGLARTSLIRAHGAAFLVENRLFYMRGLSCLLLSLFLFLLLVEVDCSLHLSNPFSLKSL